MPEARVPVRSCVGCRRRTAKAELLRLVRSADGAAAVDASGGAPGRGAYVCRDMRCFSRALSSGRLARALRVPPSALAADALHNEVERIALTAQ